MNNVITVNKKKVSIVILLTLFTVLFFYRFLIEHGIPSSIRYLLDVLNVLLFCVCINNKPTIKKEDIILLAIYLFLILFGTISYYVNAKDWPSGVLYYVFDIRSLIRFIVFFISCKNLMGQNENDLLCNYIVLFHVVNTIYVIYQFFTLEVEKYWMRGDNLNGFFGIATGGNLYLNILMIVTSIIAIDRIQRNYWKPVFSVSIILINLLIATLVELRAFYLEIIFLIFLLLVTRRKSISKKTVVVDVVVMIAFGILLFLLVKLLYKIYPWMEGSMSIKRIIEIATSSYTGTGDISRLFFVSDITEAIYENRLIDALFGVGLGTANTSGINTSFCKLFNSLHYSWYSLAYIFVELGVFGLILYPLSFISILLVKYSQTDKKYVLLSCCLIALFVIIYDEALKTEIGYLFYFLLAVPFCKQEIE